jgi:hypothetical protein
LFNKYLFLLFFLDETGGGSSSSSPSPTLKKHSDLTLRKVRRHVLQLSQHWKNANNNIQYRLKILQRAQTVDKFILNFVFFISKNIFLYYNIGGRRFTPQV